MKKILLIGLWIVSSFLSTSQTLSVYDINSKEPLEWVTLSSLKPHASAITNADGRVDVSVFKGAHTIEFRLLGYKSTRKSYAELEAANFVVYLEQSNMDLDEVVVSASRWEQDQGDVPSKIKVISAEEVLLQNPQTAADLLNVSGNVFIQKSQQGGGSPMIRGFATNRLVYVVDGVRMNTAIFRSGNLQNVINIDPFATENTEVLFGPGSVIYGSDAIGGVMSFQTLRPRLSSSNKPYVKGSAITRFSSANNEKTAHFDVNVGGKKWAFVTSFSAWDFDHLRQGSNGPDDYIKDYHVQRIDSIDRVVSQDDELLQVPSAYSQINLMQKVRYRHSEKLNIQYGFHYSETSSYGRYDRHNRVKNGTARYAEWEYGPQKWMMNNLELKYSADNHFFDEMALRMAYQAFEESRISRSFNDDIREVRTEEVDAYSTNLDFNKKLSTKNTLFYGIEYIFDDVNSVGMDEDINNGTSVVGAARYPLATWQSLAAYVSNEYRWSDKLTLQAGLRYNHFILDADFSNNLDFYPFPFSDAKINDGALTGNVGCVFRPSDEWVIKSSVGTAFRSPNVDDIGKVFDSEPGSVVVPNPNLDDEYAINFDLGVARQFGKHVKFDLTGYYTRLENAFVVVDGQLGGQDSIVYDGVMSQVQIMQNASKTIVYGFQTGLEVNIPSGWVFSSDFNFQKGEDKFDDGSTSPSRHAAPMFRVTRISYQYDKLKLQLYVNYQGEVKHEDLAESEKDKDEIYALDSNGNTYSPSWYTLNLKATYDLEPSFQLSAGIENLTDQRYRPYSSGLSGPGRNFIFSVRYRY